VRGLYPFMHTHIHRAPPSLPPSLAFLEPPDEGLALGRAGEELLDLHIAVLLALEAPLREEPPDVSHLAETHAQKVLHKGQAEVGGEGVSE
jgi:hypothetical protein